MCDSASQPIMPTGIKKRLKKVMSHIPLPILDLVLRVTARVRKSKQRRASRKRSSITKVQVKQLDPSDPYSPWFRAGKPPNTYLTDTDSFESLAWRVLSQMGSKIGLGCRKIISKEKVTLADGSVRFDCKYDNKYTWYTNFEIYCRIDSVRKGFVAMGVKKSDRVTVFLESRVEKLIVIEAILRVGAVAAMMPYDRRQLSTYYIVNQLRSQILIASTTTFQRLPALAQHLSDTRCIIVVQDEVNCELEAIDDPILTNFYEEPIEVRTLSEVESLGQRSSNEDTFNSHPDDAAFLVFTAGSTGVPKAVIWSYRSVITGVKNMTAVIAALKLPEEACCVLTPCPQIMDIMYTTILLCLGIRVAYSNPTTLMPQSSDEREKDIVYDLELLHPEVILAVPQTLNEIRILFEGRPSLRLKSFLYVNNRSKPKLGFKQSWPSDGDQYTMKYRLFGGKLKAVITGLAPVSSQTYEFLKKKLDAQHIIHHYGCAEACSSILLRVDDQPIANSGFPLWGTLIRLIDWEDGGYFVTDKPFPRGELVIGGDSISDGYFSSSLNADVFLEEHGKSWCFTGDIGEILPDGSVRIIDRKSDLMKFQSGNQVSPARVEAEIKTCSLVENVFIYGSCKFDYAIAIIRPNESELLEMAKSLGKRDDSFPFLCYDEDILKLFLDRIHAHCRSRNLYDYEIPQKIRLSSHKWTSEGYRVTDFVTGGLKLRRYQIREFFKNDLRMMYSSHDCQ